MSIYTLFQTNKDHETKGITIDYGIGGKFTVARSGGANTHYQKRLEVLVKPYRHQINMDLMDTDLARKLARQAFIECCLKGWQDVKDPFGNELPYSKENAEKLFTDLPDLFEDLAKQSNNAALFRVELLETDAKN